MRIIDSIKKRSVLFGVKKMTPEQMSDLAEKFLGQGALSDAVDFFDKAGNHEPLEKIRDQACQDGDAFLFLKCTRALKQEASVELLEACATNAEKLGKIRYAILAYERLGNEEKVEALKDSISEDLDIKAERAAQEEVFIASASDEIDELDEEEVE